MVHLANQIMSNNGSSLGHPPMASTSISSSLSVQEEEENHHHHQEQVQGEDHHNQRNVSSFRVNFTVNDWSSSEFMDDAWACLIMLVLCWFLAVSVTLVMGFYGSKELLVGPNCSYLLQANTLFVSEIKVQEVTDPKQGPALYGFYRPPPLDVETSWSETHNTSVSAKSHKEWVYHLNQGSEVDIMYSMNSQDYSPLFLVIAEGKENLYEWIEDQSNPNITLSWDIIQGSGRIQQKVFRSSDYYVAVGNLNPELVEVQLNLTIQAVLYNTTEAYYNCPLSYGQCGLKLFPLKGNVAVLSSPGPEQGIPLDYWSIEVSYEPRWVTYFVGSGFMTLIFFLVYKSCVQFLYPNGNEVRSERIPLLAPKDDDILSLGSSYDSLSHDEENFEDSLEVGSAESKQLKEGETENHRRLCMICFDSSRDCFFLPCGHCATCFTCGKRILEDSGVCPICNRKMKKLRKILTV